MSLRSLFNRRVDVQRKTYAASAVSAAGAATWATIRHGLRCRIWAVSSRELEQFGMTSGEISHVCAWSATTVLQPSDRLVEGTVTYEIGGPPQRMDGAKHTHHYEAPLLERVE